MKLAFQVNALMHSSWLHHERTGLPLTVKFSHQRRLVCPTYLVSDIAVFVLTRDVKLQPTLSHVPLSSSLNKHSALLLPWHGTVYITYRHSLHTELQHRQQQSENFLIS